MLGAYGLPTPTTSASLKSTRRGPSLSGETIRDPTSIWRSARRPCSPWRKAGIRYGRFLPTYTQSLEASLHLNTKEWFDGVEFTVSDPRTRPIDIWCMTNDIGGNNNTDCDIKSYSISWVSFAPVCMARRPPTWMWGGSEIWSHMVTTDFTNSEPLMLRQDANTSSLLTQLSFS